MAGTSIGHAASEAKIASVFLHVNRAVQASPAQMIAIPPEPITLGNSFLSKWGIHNT
tara:strand:+ start:9477 stop:9647 length:171 start_codon:yes stop_codon:yes gene_type:complete